MCSELLDWSLLPYHTAVQVVWGVARIFYFFFKDTIVLLSLEQPHGPDFTFHLFKLFCVIISWKFTHVT